MVRELVLLFVLTLNLVAICIYKPNCANSTMVLRHLEHLAKSLPHVKFARANGELVLEASSALVSSF